MNARKGRLKQKNHLGFGTWLKYYFTKRTSRKKYSNYRDEDKCHFIKLTPTNPRKLRAYWSPENK